MSLSQLCSISLVAIGVCVLATVGLATDFAHVVEGTLALVLGVALVVDTRLARGAVVEVVAHAWGLPRVVVTDERRKLTLLRAGPKLDLFRRLDLCVVRRTVPRRTIF